MNDDADNYIQRPLVYVSGPFTAISHSQIQRNIDAAKAAGMEVRKAGFVPIVPHLAVLNDDPAGFTYEEAMAECLSIMKRCDAVLLIRGWEKSKGAQIEQRHALARNMILAFSVIDLRQEFVRRMELDPACFRPRELA